MSQPEIIRIDGVKWWITTSLGSRMAQPLCPQHNLRLQAKPGQHFSQTRGKYVDNPILTSTKLECAEGPHILEIPRELEDEQNYVINKIDSLVFKNMSVMNLDDEVTPVALDEIKKDSPYWVRAKVTESKSGVRLIVWAGDKSKKSKTQLFVEPELKRLSFDQNDDHPTEIFAKVEAIFSNNIKSTIEHGKKE